MAWDISEERAFIENLLNQRFNFFLVFFSLVIAGAMSAPSQLFFQTVLILGALICWLLSLTIARSQQKLDILLSEIFEDKSHPATIADDACLNKGSRRKIIGYTIPKICCSFLTVVAVLAVFNFVEYVKK